MTILKPIFVIIILAFTLQSCSNPNDRVYKNLINRINDSIEKNNAEEFNYTYDILLPQKSFFVISKIKLLTLRASGEFCDSETNYLFDLKNDSIILEIRKQECYEDHNRWTKKSDTIYVIDYMKKTEEKYFDGILTKSKKINPPNQRNEYIYEIKLKTENKYNNR